jgi:hypothetical protein
MAFAGLLRLVLPEKTGCNAGLIIADKPSGSVHTGFDQIGQFNEFLYGKLFGAFVENRSVVKGAIFSNQHLE